MKTTLTVEQAIKKGKWIVNYPVLAMFIIAMAISFYLVSNEITGVWIIPTGFGLAFIVSWLYWSIVITRWKLWAFGNVRNVHELKNRAIEEKLIWREGSIFEKTAIQNKRQAQQWAALQPKFERKDIFLDDANLPNEYIIYFDKYKQYPNLFIAILLIGMSIVFYDIDVADEYLYYAIPTILIIISLHTLYSALKKITNKRPQIILNDKGMWSVKTYFYTWDFIEDETISNLYDNRQYYLCYTHPAGNTQLNIDHYNITSLELRRLLRIYRLRYDNKRSPKKGSMPNT